MAVPYPTGGSSGGTKSPRGDRTAKRLFVVDRRLLPQAPDRIEQKAEKLRLHPSAKRRPNYWAGIDWRNQLPGTLTVLDQKKSDACSGFAVAHALRLNLALHRNADVKVNPYLVWGLARELDPRWQYGKAGLLHSALLIVNNYAIPTLPKFSFSDALQGNLVANVRKLAIDFASDRERILGAQRKIQGIVDLGQYLGDLSAWLHAFGPVPVHMMIDRPLFDAVSEKQPLIEFDGDDAYEAELSTRFAGHDVVVVGYVPVQEKDHRLSDTFIIMNSYGDGWGDKGFAYVKVKTAQRCFRAAFGLLLREHLGYQLGGRPGPQIRSRLAAAERSE